MDGITVYYLYFLIAVAISKFCYLLHFFAKIIKALNDELKNFSPNIWVSEEFIGGNKNNSDLLIFNNTPDISTFVDVFMEICHCFEEINRCFGMATLIASLMTFLALIDCSYYFIIYGQMLLFVASLGYFAPYSWLILYSCERAADEVRFNVLRFLCTISP